MTNVQEKINTTNTKNKSGKNKQNLYETVTQQIIDKMKEGNLVWSNGFGIKEARNWISKKKYSGINYILLNFIYEKGGSEYFATFKQIQAMGGTIKKGSKGKCIFFAKKLYQKEGKYISLETYTQLNKGEKLNVDSFGMLKKYYVFNMMDTENCKGFDYEAYQEKANLVVAPNDESIQRKYEAVLNAYTDKPKFEEHFSRNYYKPLLDTIGHVARSKWTSQSAFIATIFHELIHSTGHPKRLKRSHIKSAFGTATYAEEELVAELGAAMLCHHIGILPKEIENMAAYLSGWIKVLENDTKLIFRAAAQAQKAVDYILS